MTEIIRRSACFALAFSILAFSIVACAPRDPDSSNANELATRPAAPADANDKAATLVRVGRLTRGEIRTSLEVSTDIEAEVRVSVFPKVGNTYLTEILVKEGSDVKKGDVLARLDDIDFRIAERRRESELLQAQLGEKQAAVRLAEAVARERAQRAMHERAKSDFERAQNAMQGGIDVLSVKEITDASSSFEQAEAELEASTLAAELLRSELELSSVTTEATRIELEAARNDLAQTVIRAPIDGVIEDRSVDAGLLVSPQTQLFTIVDPLRLVANLRVPQEDLSRVSRLGLPVEFRLDALPTMKFVGRVEAINPSVDPASGLIKIRVRLDDEAASSIRPGMFARARIIIDSRENAFLLNKRAVVYDDGRAHFFTAQDGVARRHAFVAGASTETDVEVLEIDETPPVEAAMELDVIMVGQDRLRDGDPITVIGGPS